MERQTVSRKSDTDILCSQIALAGAAHLESDALSAFDRPAADRALLIGHWQNDCEELHCQCDLFCIHEITNGERRPRDWGLLIETDCVTSCRQADELSSESAICHQLSCQLLHL